jgi:hypothetical protein
MWLKISPSTKNKSPTKEIENYKTIPNLSSASNIFEKLILEIQDKSGVDLTGINLHGYKTSRSTCTLLIKPQSLSKST